MTAQEFYQQIADTLLNAGIEEMLRDFYKDETDVAFDPHSCMPYGFQQVASQSRNAIDSMVPAEVTLPVPTWQPFVSSAPPPSSGSSSPKFKVGDRVRNTDGDEGIVTNISGYFCTVQSDWGITLFWDLTTLTLITVDTTPKGAVTNATIAAWGVASQDRRSQLKSEGRCQVCGELLPMSIHGLGGCPVHGGL